MTKLSQMVRLVRANTLCEIGCGMCVEVRGGDEHAARLALASGRARVDACAKWSALGLGSDVVVRCVSLGHGCCVSVDVLCGLYVGMGSGTELSPWFFDGRSLGVCRGATADVMRVW